MEIRLQKILSQKGLCSRREAERLIIDGRVKVDGQPAHLGQKVDPALHDIVVNGRSIRTLSQPRTVIAINKPVGYTCSNDDVHAEKLIFELLPREYRGLKLFVAGRLDRDSSGLVIVTNDGDLAHKLTHPSNQIQKRYHVKFAPALSGGEFEWFLEGQKDEGELLRFERIITPPKKTGPFFELDVILNHGKKREIRRLFAISGREVGSLQRLSIGGFRVSGIPTGAYKKLSGKDVQSLLAEMESIR